MKRWVMSAVALLIAYGNLAVILHPSKFGLGTLPGLPRPPAIHDAFLVTGMFNSYTEENLELFLEGETTGEGSTRTRWMAISVSEHFPQRRAVAYTQLFAPHHWDMYGPEAQREAWAGMARRIRARHNRLHPDQPVARVRFGTNVWPQHPAGYDAARRPGQTDRRLWFSESTPVPETRK